MLRLALPGILGTLMFCVWIYALLDSIATDSALVRNLPKITWVMLIVFVPFAGALAWLGFGRPINAGWQPGDTTMRSYGAGPRGLEDTAQWSHGRPPMAPAPAPEESIEVRERRLAEREAELRRREAELDADGDDTN